MPDPEPDWDTVMEMEAESRRDALLAEIREGRVDPAFMARLRERVTADRELLNLLADQEAEAEREDADFTDEWDDPESNAYQDRVEAGLEQEDSSDGK